MKERTIKKSTISLLDLTGEIFNSGDTYYVEICNENNGQGFVEYTRKETLKLLDPTYDQTFKSIFTYGENMSSIPRLKSFLNSLLYNKYKESIVEIEYAPNELASLGDKGRKNLLVFDIIVKAKFESKKYIFIDIEIQTAFHSQLFMRQIKYANALYTNIKKEILVLVLQVDNREESSFWTLAPYMITYSNPIQQNKINETFEIINLDIKKTIELIKDIKDNESIQFGDIIIGNKGKNWLKLIGLRFWVKKKEGYYFYLPKIKNACPEILGALEILSCFNDSQAKEIIRSQIEKEKDFEDGYFKGKEEGKQEGKEEGKEEGKKESDLKTWMRLFKKNININKDGDLFPDLGKVTEKTVKELFPKDPFLVSFIQFLKNNDKILDS